MPSFQKISEPPHDLHWHKPHIELKFHLLKPHRGERAPSTPGIVSGEVCELERLDLPRAHEKPTLQGPILYAMIGMQSLSPPYLEFESVIPWPPHPDLNGILR